MSKKVQEFPVLYDKRVKIVWEKIVIFLRENTETAVDGCSDIKLHENTRGGVLL